MEPTTAEMESINRQLFDEVNEITARYNLLERSHQEMIDSFNSFALESQNKWFQLTKDLVRCSKGALELAARHMQEGDFQDERKFYKLRRKIEKYEKFSNKQVEELLSQSQDVSIFDRPSVHEISTHTANLTQKNATTFFSIEEYMPVDYQKLRS